MNPILMLTGAREVYADAASRTALLELCLENGWAYSNFCWLEDGGISFQCSLVTAQHIKRVSRQRGISVRVRGIYGFPAFLCILRRRLGLLIGGAAAIGLLILSGLFVWDIEVVGNKSVSTHEIREILQECDFGVGSYIPKVEIPALENRVLLASDRLSWISVNLDGTVARVQVIERVGEERPLLPPSSASPANLIASRDGQIELICLYRGKSVVKKGQAVKKGELLVSGIYDSQTEGYRLTRAAGEVMARTERIVSVEIPFRYEEKIPLTSQIYEIRLNFFNFSLKIFKNAGNMLDTCDIIENNYSIGNFGSRPLPVSFTVTRAHPYTCEERVRNEEEALAAAYEALEEQLESLSYDVEMLRKQIETEWTESGIKLTCRVLCIENIAEQVEIEIKKQE